MIDLPYLGAKIWTTPKLARFLYSFVPTSCTALIYYIELCHSQLSKIAMLKK